MPSRRVRLLRRARGTSLLEALIAFGALSMGILAVGRVQAHLRLNSDVARQRSEAVRLAQEDVETVRAFSVLAASAGLRSYAEIAGVAVTIDTASGYATNTRYRVTRDVQAAPTTRAKHLSVDVVWSDRSGSEQRIVLSSIIAARDPIYSAALRSAPTGTPVKGAFGRSVSIPLSAKDLGDGRSAFKPEGAADVAYVFDNFSGLVVARCSGLDPALTTRLLTPAELAGCDGAASGYLLSGTVRFSLATPPSAAPARDTPLPLALSVALDGGTYAVAPSCTASALKTARYSSGTSTRLETVPIDAVPALLGLATWIDDGDRFVAYHCVIYPLADGHWSGRTTLTPSGWSIGTGPADLRVCRFSADVDGSGAIDANIEHPAEYRAVAGALAHQNFLVIRATQACPAGRPAELASAPAVADGSASLATLPHQP